MTASQDAEVEALLGERQRLEAEIAAETAQQAAAHAEALQALRARCIQACDALVADLSNTQQELERRLLVIQSEHILAADMLRIRERQLAEKDSENAHIAHQLKRQITRERATLQASKTKWSAEEKSLRDEQTKLNSDYSRGAMQFRQLDAKHAVLDTADSRRRADIDVTDTEMLTELSASCALAVQRLQQYAQIPVDGVAPSEDFIAEVSAALEDIARHEDTGAASGKALRILESLNAAILSQRHVLDTRAAILTELQAVRRQQSPTRPPSRANRSPTRTPMPF